MFLCVLKHKSIDIFVKSIDQESLKTTSDCTKAKVFISFNSVKNFFEEFSFFLSPFEVVEFDNIYGNGNGSKNNDNNKTAKYK